MNRSDEQIEWLEADGLGGFASGTAGLVRTRRYHALLLAATTPPTGRVVLVNGLDAFVTTPAGRFALSTQRYGPDVLHPDGSQRIVAFRSEPWPTWEFDTPDGYRIRQEIVVEYQRNTTLVVWTLVAGGGAATIEARPFLSGRDYHSTHHENGAFDFTPERRDHAWVWRPYQTVPAIEMATNGDYRHDPQWYRNFLYTAERDRGLDALEDLASPGVVTWTLQPDAEAVAMFSVADRQPPGMHADPRERAAALRLVEHARRSRFSTPLERAGDAFLVRRGHGRSLVAGYPWFTDWGRDTFIAIRGLCIGTGRLTDARAILVEWSTAVSEGMLPNRFPDAGEAPEFNAVDAALWFVVAAHDLLMHPDYPQTPAAIDDRRRLERAILAIVDGYAAGTRFGIRADSDGLLAAGEPGVQLTWMDARVGDRVITPRMGKPVEVQALWINALHVAAMLDQRWAPTLRAARQSFGRRFWNADRSCLYDVVDVNHVRGAVDPTIRPNQILAVGGLPFAVIEGTRARGIVDVIERALVTPMGLRSLAPEEPGYAPRYEGGPGERDAIYHQGTVWPWLMGPFVDAWLRVRGNSDTARDEADRRFLTPLLEHVETVGLGHLCEIADATAPFTPRGCPFQAWSLGELLRLVETLRRRPAAISDRRSAIS